MKHIVIVGDSFTEEIRGGKTIFDYRDLQPQSLINILGPNTIKFGTYIALDIINQKKQNEIKIHTLSKGSAGNHYISEKLFERISEIKNENPNDEIFAIVQLSGFFRAGLELKNNIKHIDIEKYPHDYFHSKKYLSFDDLKKGFLIHFQNIINIDEFCNKNNVKKIVFFGWSTIHDHDVKIMNLEDSIDKIKNIVQFFPHQKILDEMSYYCTGVKYVYEKNNHTNLYEVKPNSFGGMTEYVREKQPIGERYYLNYDPHLSSKSNLIFYKDIIKKWLIHNDVILDYNYDEELTNKLNTIFQIEKIRYNMFPVQDSKISRYVTDILNELLNKNETNIKIYIENFQKILDINVKPGYLF